jgi:hypothetical protein
MEDRVRFTPMARLHDRTILPIATLVGAIALVAAACGSASTAGDVDVPASTSTTSPPQTTVATTTTTEQPSPRIATYFVGDSHTAQALGPEAEGYRSWYVLVTQADYVADPFGWHITCGSSLVGIAEDPEEACESSTRGESVEEAIGEHDWDFVSFQASPGPGSTFGSDLDLIESYTSDLARSTTVLIHTSWPTIDGFFETWESTVELDMDTPTRSSRQYVETLAGELASRIPNDVLVVPVGEVLFQLDQRLDAGEVPGLDGIEDLYSDNIHLKNPGSWLVGVTLASVILDVDPAAFGKPREPWYGDGSEYPTGFIPTVREVVTGVLASN